MPEELQVNKVRFLRGDKQIWFIVLLLAVISVLEVYSTTASLAYRKMGGDTAYFLVRQVAYLGAGFFMIFIFQMIPTRYYIPWSLLILVITVVLLAVTLFRGSEFNSARRWYSFYGLSVQPSELVRVPLVLYLSGWMARHQDKLGNLREGVFPLVGWILLVCGLIMPENLSTALLLGITSGVLLMVGRVRWRHLGLLAVVGAGLFALSLVVLPKVVPNSRVTTWSNRVASFMGESGGSDGFQAHQAKIAVAGGLLWGKGPGKSTQRLLLPESYSDFIYANIIEEGGMLAGLFVMSLYIWLLWRVRCIVRKSSNPYHVYLCVGLVTMIVLQAFAHMMISVGLLPVTGLPLPFISAGGSSILVTGIALGMIQSVARQQRKEDLYAGEKPEV